MLVVDENTKKTNPPMEADAYIARCVQIIDLGDQYNKMGDKYQRNVMLTFEFPTETVEVMGEEKPRLLSKTYNFTMNEKGNLRKDIESWIGKLTAADFPFDIRRLLGLPCMIGVTLEEGKDGKRRNKIKSIMKPMKGIAIPEQVTPSVVFDIDGDNAFEEVEKLPEWIANMIKESPSWKEVQDKKDLADFSDMTGGELPF